MNRRVIFINKKLKTNNHAVQLWKKVNEIVKKLVLSYLKSALNLFFKIHIFACQNFFIVKQTIFADCVTIFPIFTDSDLKFIKICEQIFSLSTNGVI